MEFSSPRLLGQFHVFDLLGVNTVLLSRARIIITFPRLLGQYCAPFACWEQIVRIKLNTFPLILGSIQCGSCLLGSIYFPIAFWGQYRVSLVNCGQYINAPGLDQDFASLVCQDQYSLSSFAGGSIEILLPYSGSIHHSPSFLVINISLFSPVGVNISFSFPTEDQHIILLPYWGQYITLFPYWGQYITLLVFWGQCITILLLYGQYITLLIC